MQILAHKSRAPGAGQNLVLGREAEAPPSYLGTRVCIRGALEVDGELVISGHVAGRIAAIRLVIAKGGLVEGDIVAHEVVIAGHVNGRVFAPSVTIEDGAEVEGRVFHTNITVARGARITGRMPWRPISYFETLDKLPEVRP